MYMHILYTYIRTYAHAHIYCCKRKYYVCTHNIYQHTPKYGNFQIGITHYFETKYHAWTLIIIFCYSFVTELMIEVMMKVMHTYIYMHILHATKENIMCAHITYINTPQNTEKSRMEIPVILK